MTTVVRAVAAGVGVLLAGNLPWVAALAPLNLRVLPVVPWAIVPMALYLWAMSNAPGSCVRSMTVVLIAGNTDRNIASSGIVMLPVSNF